MQNAVGENPGRPVQTSHNSCGRMWMVKNTTAQLCHKKKKLFVLVGSSERDPAIATNTRKLFLPCPRGVF